MTFNINVNHNYNEKSKEVDLLKKEIEQLKIRIENEQNAHKTSVAMMRCCGNCENHLSEDCTIDCSNTPFNGVCDYFSFDGLDEDERIQLHHEAKLLK